MDNAVLTLDICYPRIENNPNGDPLPTQEKFHQSNAKYRMLAGGFGTGKTTAICLEMAKDIAIPNNYILFGRKDLQELKSTTLKEFIDIYEPAIIDHNKQERRITFNNGTEIFYTNLDESREAIKKINSLNLGSAYIDQAEELTESMFIAISGRLRRANARRNFVGAMNPEGHNWIWRYFINEKKEGYEIFITTTLENIYLPPDYVESLLAMPENWVKRFVYCSFEDFEGIVYNEFIETKHKIGLYEPAPTEQEYIILDYGFRNPTCVLFASVDYDGVVRIYDEYYERGKLISDISSDIRRYETFERAIKLADPSINNTQRDGLSISDEFLKYQIYFRPANNNVSQGINRVNEMFKQGKLLISAKCVNTLREIGVYKWKELRPGQERNEYEEPVKQDDHAMDCLRYMANHICIPQEEEKKASGERARVIQHHNIYNYDKTSI